MADDDVSEHEMFISLSDAVFCGAAGAMKLNMPGTPFDGLVCITVANKGRALPILLTPEIAERLRLALGDLRRSTPQRPNQN